MALARIVRKKLDNVYKGVILPILSEQNVTCPRMLCLCDIFGNYIYSIFGSIFFLILILKSNLFTAPSVFEIGDPSQ